MPLDDLLPGPVGRVGLAGDHDLHRALVRRQDAAQALLVAEQQVGALVGREAAREADGQRVGIEHAAHLAQGRRRLAVAGELAGEAPFEEADHLALLLLVGAPQLRVVELVQVGELLRTVEVDLERHLHGAADERAAPGDRARSGRGRRS